MRLAGGIAHIPLTHTTRATNTGDPGHRVRRGAAQTLAKLGASGAAAAAVLAGTSADAHQTVRRPALWALGWVAAECGLPPGVVLLLGEVVLSHNDMACRR